MKAIGVVLVILGIVGFATGGFKFTRKEKVANLGPLEVTQSKTERIPIAPKPLQGGPEGAPGREEI